jgi:hypothetical protein
MPWRQKLTKKAEKNRQPYKKQPVLLLVAQFFQNCVGFKIFLAGLQKGIRRESLFCYAIIWLKKSPARARLRF